MVRTPVATRAHREVARRDAVTYLRRGLQASSELTSAENPRADLDALANTGHSAGAFYRTSSVSADLSGNQTAPNPAGCRHS
jgi:hypothetical protein